MIARVFQYSCAQARTRTLKGKLLTPEDWHYILGMRNLGDVLRYLRGTSYAGALSGLSFPGSDRGAASLALHDELFADYARLLRAVPSRSAHLLSALLLRYEAENIKTILRGVWQGEASSKVASLLYQLGPLSRLPIEDLLQARQVMDALELLKGSWVYLSLDRALPQFQTQGRIFLLEVAIDTGAFEHLRASLRHVGGIDRKRAQALIGEMIDMANLSWVIRFRHFYGLSAEEVINYTLSGGLHLDIRTLGAAARATDPASLASALPHPYRDAIGRADEWTQIRALLGKWFVGELHKAFLRDPFQIALPLSYLLLKEIEVKSLESVFSAVELGEPADCLMKSIYLPVKGGIRV